jgi:hypothetical protein
LPNKKIRRKKRMHKTKSLIAMFLLIVLAVPMIIQASMLAPVQAVNMNVPVYLQVYAEPNPVGVGQTVFISMFFTKPIPTTGGQVYTGLTLNIVKPDGTNDTRGPYVADTTGGVGGIQYAPTEIGNYTVQAFYPGQNITTGEHLIATLSQADTFTVQQDPIPGANLVPLPTEYWSRPIYATNYLWSNIGGNWWGLFQPSFTSTGGYDATGNNFNPYSTAPNSAHVMWVKPTAFGGQVGGPISGDQESQYTSTSILYNQFEPIILNGIIYYKLYPNTPTSPTSADTPGINAVDLRTGKLIWHKDAPLTPLFGWNMQFHTVQEYGTQAYLVCAAPSQPAQGSVSSYSVWQVLDPLTGYFIANITSGPSAGPLGGAGLPGIVETRDYNTQGAVYYYSVTSGNLTMWNSTRCFQGGTPFGAASSGSTIRPSGNINFTRGNQWQVVLPTNISGAAISPSLTIAGRSNDVILLRSYSAELSTFSTQFGGPYEVECGYNATNGQLLWGPVNRTDLPDFHEVSVIAVNEKYWVEHDKDTNQAYTYNMLTGQRIGSVITLPGNALSKLERGGAIAYDKCYIWDFGGYVNAIDLTTGTLAWTYTPRDAGYNTPYGIYPFWHFGSHSLADGKLFLSEARMYDPPMFADAHKVAINCTDGSVVWTGLGFYGREPSAIADGYMVAWNSYDCQIYTYGKGPSETTANVQQNIVQYGSSVLITGNVWDKSTGTTDDERSAAFPSGVPAVSDDSQTTWMAYVYMQQPKPTNATGVPVTVFVVDQNGNYREIGRTQTDDTGFYNLQWKPDIDGKYTVYVKFGGTESYWPSQATTAFQVDPAAPTATPTPVPAQSVADQYFIPAIAGLFIAIIVIGAIMVLLLVRRRP